MIDYRAEAEALVIQLAQHPADRAAKIDVCMQALHAAAEQATSRENEECATIADGGCLAGPHTDIAAMIRHRRDPERPREAPPRRPPEEK